MRKLTFLLLVIMSISIIQNSYAQTWSPLKRLTSGYKDTNPAFAPQSQGFMFVYPFEILVFQRAIDTSSQICAMKLASSGPLESPVYLTTNNFKKRNPCIAYTIVNYNDTIRNAFALWETNQNGKWDIYGAYYTSAGWGPAFPVDSGAGNKYNPSVMIFSTTEFGMVYTREDDIIYRRYNAATRTVISEMNFTSSISSPCNSALIAQPYFGPLAVSFRYQKPDNSFGIYKLASSNSGTSWSSIDTVGFMGNNVNSQISVGNGSPQYIFESDRTGKSSIYCTSSGFQAGQQMILGSPFFNYYQLKSWFFPIITDAYVSSLSVALKKTNDSIKVMLDPTAGTGSNPNKDSATVGDTSKNVTLALNNGLRQGSYYLFYAVFNKDTANQTSLYCRTRLHFTSDIRSISNAVSDNFNLYQNYPNPFNPTTKIKFDIPKQSDVKLIIFDAVGREVKNITQDNLTAGSYEYEFKGESLSSGIYYFKLQANEFSKTMKMVLVK